MCSTSKSGRTRSVKSHNTTAHQTTEQAARFTAIANATDDRRQELKAHQKLLQMQNPDPQPQKTQVKGWRYWTLEVCLFSILKQKLLGRTLQGQ